MSTDPMKASFPIPFDVQAEAKPNATPSVSPKDEPELDSSSIPEPNRSALDAGSVITGAGSFIKPGFTALLEACNDSPRVLMIIGAPAALGIALILVFVLLLGISAGLWGIALLFRPIGKKIVKAILRILVKLITVTVFTVEVAALAVALYITAFTIFKCLNRTEFSQTYVRPALKVTWKGVYKPAVKQE